MLWLCLHLPRLPLEIFTRAQPTADADRSRALAVSDGQTRTPCVLMANDAAMRCGVRPGMSVAAAHVLARNLIVRDGDILAERYTLERLAAWAGQFTSHVSLIPGQGLLLEVEGSLRLFGGLSTLRAVLQAGITELGFDAVLSVAPTPLAALWLARIGEQTPVVDLPTLTGRLFGLPLTCLEFPEKQKKLLRDLGLTTVGDCLRLPRDGLARRFGAEFIDALDRAFGRAPDPREFFVAPPTYRSALVLPGGVDSVEGVLFPLNRLLLELDGFLTARIAGVQELTLVLMHARSAPTTVDLGLARPTRDTRHLKELFRERFAQLVLSEPVEEITLSAPRLLPLGTTERDFFIAKGASVETVSELIERLSVRLGRDAVRGLAVLAEHRPERAWHYTEPAVANVVALPETLAERPLWLLVEPMRLEIRNGQPTLDGALDLEPDNERIESGWWDGGDIRRDYFIARDGVGARLWIYRDVSQEPRWWLHGVFA